MGNLGGLEIVAILLVALVVLGPKKLPEATRQVARVVGELKRISSGFQKEMREAIEDPLVEAEARAEGARVTAVAAGDDPAKDANAGGDLPPGTNDETVERGDSGETEETEAVGEPSDPRTSP